jgi:hypothetical protein
VSPLRLSRDPPPPLPCWSSAQFAPVGTPEHAPVIYFDCSAQCSTAGCLPIWHCGSLCYCVIAPSELL